MLSEPFTVIIYAAFQKALRESIAPMSDRTVLGSGCFVLPKAADCGRSTTVVTTAATIGAVHAKPPDSSHVGGISAAFRDFDAGRPKRRRRHLLNCAYRCASFAASRHRCIACGGEPPWPPVPIACNTKKRRADHNANQCRVNKHSYR
jgi:hypothetical protein